MVNRSTFLREVLLFLAFLGLTFLATWPWVWRIRDAVPDAGDPYAYAWILWWDYYQTFHDPLNLFHSNTFFPYRYTLAFSEHNYGIALLFFPLFALGFRPLTIVNAATLIGFAFSGYSTFRLMRTLTGSTGGAWVAGVIFAFIPYRFNNLANLPYIFSGWIPLLFEAVVLFMRERSRKRATWLGVAFFMNALSSITWSVLSLIPLAVSALLLLVRYRIGRDPAVWRRSGVALAAASVAVLPFALPLYWASNLYGFTQPLGEVAKYSAFPIHWLTTEWRNKLWHGMGVHAAGSEISLFPGFLPLLLTLAAIFFVERWPRPSSPSPPPPQYHQGDAGLPSSSPLSPSPQEVEVAASPKLSPGAWRAVLVSLDTLAVILLVVWLITTGFGIFRLRFFDYEISLPIKPLPSFVLLVTTLLIRWSLAYPAVFRTARGASLFETLRAGRRSEALGLGMVWAVIGFLGSLGMNFFFHRALYEYVFIFRSMRGAARWSIICYLGLALLGGQGASRVAELLSRYRSALRKPLIYVLIVAATVFEQRAAPLYLIRGEVDPDQLTLHLKETSMSGGIVELPSGKNLANHRYMLRAADHARPLVTAVSSFVPPIVKEIEMMTNSRPIPHRLLDLLESIPTSYLVVHNSYLNAESQVALQSFLIRGIAAGRLRFIGSCGKRNEDILYAVTKVEPDAPKMKNAAPAPAFAASAAMSQLSPLLANLPAAFGSEGYFIYRFYKASYGRMPRLAEFMNYNQALKQKAAAVNVTNGDLQSASEQSASEQSASRRRQFADTWIDLPSFKQVFDRKTNREFVDALFANTGVERSEAERDSLVNGLTSGAETRSTVLLKLVEREAFYLREFNKGFVLLHYFAYLQRNPDDPPDNSMAGYDFWLSTLNHSGDYQELSNNFTASNENRTRSTQHR